MKKLILLFILAIGMVVSMAANRTGAIRAGMTTLSMPMTFGLSDTIDISDSVSISITNVQKYMQHQTFSVALATVSGSPSVTITAYGKVTSTSSWVQIGSPITWTTTANNGDITSTSPVNYNYFLVTFVSSAATQKSKITSFSVKTSNAYDIPANSGTLTISRATTGAVTVTSKDNDANAATTYRAGGTGALTLGSTAGTTAISSSDWDIDATGIATGLGAITADGLITGTAGATLSGAAINLNASSNFAVNVGTGSTASAVTIGGGSNTVAINSSDWDITTTGVVTGLGAVTMDGALNSLDVQLGMAIKVATATADADSTVVASKLADIDQFVTVTSGAAARIITLPATTASSVGRVIRGWVGANGFELRVATADAATVKINDKTTNVEAAIPATTLFKVECVSATEWILTATDELGAVITAIVPDAL